MPANLTPAYKAAEQRFRAARSLPERVAALQEMLAVIPKHKGTDHLRADLRSRLAKLLDFAEALHRGWEKRLKYAVLWGASGRFDAQRVGKDHVLADGDALELHG